MMGRTKNESPQKRKKKIKDANKPKRPTSAYFYFLADCRARAQKEGRSISKIAEFTKESSVQWREMTDTVKKQFNDKAAIDKARYEEQMAGYKPPRGGKTGGKVEDGKPKRPQSAYFLFLADHREDCKTRNVGHKDVLRTAGEKWRGMDEEDKAPYEKAALEEQKKYEKAMEEWRSGGSTAVGASAPKKMKQSNGQPDEVEEDDEEDDDEEEDEEEDDE